MDLLSPPCSLADAVPLGPEPRGADDGAATMPRRGDQSAREKRIRNRSLCNLLCTPPPYPGYTSLMGSLATLPLSAGPVEPPQLSHKYYYHTEISVDVDTSETSVPSARSLSRSTGALSSSGVSSALSSSPGGRPPLVSPDDFQLDEDEGTSSSCSHGPHKASGISGSSGYGSTGSEEEEPSMTTYMDSSGFSIGKARCGRTKSRHEREIEKWRRRSVPASLRNAFSDDVMRILHKDGHICLQTDVDSGLSYPMEVRGINRPESVLQLARKFSEISAMQDIELARARTAPRQWKWKAAEKNVEGKENTATAADVAARMMLQGATPNAATMGTVPPPRKSSVRIFPERTVGGIASLSAPKQHYIKRDQLVHSIHHSQPILASSPSHSRLLSPVRGIPKEMPVVNPFKAADEQAKKAAAANGTPVCVVNTSNPKSIKDALLRWIQSRVQGYPVTITNFSSSWCDGMAFCALIHRFVPNAFDFASLKPENRRQNFELAFKVAEDAGIWPLLEVDDMIAMGDRPDWKCVFTYVQCFYSKFKDHP